MHTLDPTSVFVTRTYRNRPHSVASNSPRPDPLCDVLYVVHGDAELRDEICSCFSTLETKVVAFADGSEYLASTRKDTAACLILDTHLPDIDGFDLQKRLAGKSAPPVIFISDHVDVTTTVRAMKTGAVEFLTRPVDLRVLASAVQAALAQDRKQRRKQSELAELQTRFSLLTPREREVLPLVVGGLLNKQAASLLGISEVTLQIHRSHVMRKTRANSFADLVRMAMKLRIPYWQESNSDDHAKPTPALDGQRPDHGALLQSAAH